MNGSTWLDRTNYFVSFNATDDNMKWAIGWQADAMVNSFIAQNHGAGKEDRIHAGYRSALKIVLPWGLFCTILLVCFPTPIFKIFITEPDVIPMGISYLMILGFSQLFSSLEITTRWHLQ